MEPYQPIGSINMKKWWEYVIELIVLIPLKILELLLNCFAFICMAIAWPIIKIIKAIKGENNGK